MDLRHLPKEYLDILNLRQGSDKMRNTLLNSKCHGVTLKKNKFQLHILITYVQHILGIIL